MYDEDDLDIQCQLCDKTFSNDIAIRNHVGLEHDEADVDIEEWIEMAIDKIDNKGRATKKKTIDPEVARAIENRKRQLVAKMAPQNLITALASESVQYVIFNMNDEDKKVVQKKRKRKRKSRAKRVESQEKVEIEIEIETPYGTVKLERGEVGKKKKMPPGELGPFTCRAPACGRVYESCCDYTRHHLHAHAARRNTTLCQVCEKSLVDSTQQHPCTLCKASFPTAGALASHRAAHRPAAHGCALCGKAFAHRAALAAHARLHSGDRPFKCAHCPKQFAQKTSLRLHEHRHTDTKPYECVVCGRGFRQPTGRRQHMRTHTQNAPYKCSMCSCAFKQGSQLKAHELRHRAAERVEEDGVFYDDETELCA